MSSSAWIYSINPFPVLCEAGVFGQYIIPAKEQDERYSRIEIKARPYAKDKGNDEFEPQVDSGYKVARDLVDRNPGLGMIVSEDLRGPTKDQVAQATEEMRAADIIRVERGDTLYARSKNRGDVSGESRQACIRLGVIREWVDRHGDDKQLKACRGCSELILPSAMICKHCGWNQALDPVAVATAAMTAPSVPAVPKEPVQG